MAKLINLLPEISAEQKKKDIRLWYLNIGAIGLLLITGLVLVGLFAFKTYTQSQIDAAEASISSATQDISKQAEVVNLVTFINSKVSKLEAMWPKSRASSDLKRTISLFPDTVTVTGYEQNNLGDYVLAATTTVLGDFDAIIDSVRQVGLEQYRDYQFRAINENDDGLYTFNLTFVNKSKAKPVVKNASSAAGADVTAQTVK